MSKDAKPPAVVPTTTNKPVPSPPPEAAKPPPLTLPADPPVFKNGQKLMCGQALKQVIGIAVQKFVDGPGGPNKPRLEWNYLMGAVDDEGECCWDWHYAQWHRDAEMKTVAQHIGGLQYRGKDVVDDLQRRSK